MNHRLVWTVHATNLPGRPDGAQVDAQGYLWIVLSGSSQAHVDPATGTVDMVVHLPVKCLTSVMFGGLDLDELFNTRSRWWRSLLH